MPIIHKAVILYRTVSDQTILNFSYEELLQQNTELRADLAEANETLRAIRSGEVDAIVVSTTQGNQVFTLKSADHPYRVLIEEMKNGALTLADNGTILYANHYFAGLIGRSHSQIISTSFYDYIEKSAFKSLQKFLQATWSGQNLQLELNLALPDIAPIPVQLAANTLYFDQIRVTCLVMTDLRAQKQRDADMTLLQTLGLEISQAHNLHSALRGVLERIGLKMDWEMGEVWIGDKESYRRIVSWHNKKPLNAFDDYSQNVYIPIGEGLVGRTWLGKSPIWFTNIADEIPFQRQEKMLKTGIRAGVGIPIVAQEKIVAVILFYALKPRPEDPGFIQMMSTVISHLGTYIVRKQAEEQIRYQAKFLETVRDPMISTNTDSMIISWNHAAEVTYGWSAAEVIGKAYRDILPHQYPFDTHEHVIGSFLQQQHWTGELVQTTRAGRKLHVLTSLSMMRDDIGKPIGAVITHRDITERKVIENALLEAHQQLVVLNHIMTQTSTTLDTHTLLELACNELGQVFEVPRVLALIAEDNGDELKVVAEYVKDGYKPTIGEIVSRQSKELATINSPIAIQNALNDPRLANFKDLMTQHKIVSMLIIPLVSHEKNIGSICVFTTQERIFTELEITLANGIGQVISPSLENSLLHKSIADQNIILEQTVEKRTEQLKRLYERMSTILDNTSDAIILTTSAGQIENTNLAFDNLFLYERDKMLGESVSQLSGPNHRAEMMIALNNVVRDRNRIEHLQIVAARKGGSTFDVDCSLAYVSDSDGFIVWSIRDITHLKQVGRMKDQFVSMVSHELRTPLSGMLLSASSLQRYYDRLNDEKRREIIDRLNNQGAVMVELIESILDLSRIDSRTIEPGNALIDMHQVVEKVIIQLQDMINSKKHVLKLNPDIPTKLITGSEIDFTRIWRNLISNAIKYTPDGGTITLSLGLLTITSPFNVTITGTISPDTFKLPPDMLAGEYMIGQVHDTGRGIPPADLDQLFTRFFRGSASQGSTPGTGLGLSLVRELLNLYGGNISVVSEVNVGSVFSFWIPIQKENQI